MKAGAKQDVESDSEYFAAQNKNKSSQRSIFDKEQEAQNRILSEIRKRPAYNNPLYGNIEENEKTATPNPFYHHQRKKLLMRYQKQLLEKDFENKEETNAMS